MKPVRKQRLYLILAMVVAIAVAAGFGLNAFNQNLMFFFAPTEVVAGKAPDTAVFRLGGMVVEGSVQRPGDDLRVRFDLTDFEQVVSVEYTGILPDLFREGQGIVSRGRLRADGVFVAEEVLAKHDENYMPPEVADSLKKAPGDLE
ncbi:MAG: cytochrome c maturation protein CcmE [Methylococcales bacterium]|jgi:cytochrome c-type biogenesis protein CcmE|nr:cytochrome c maturation protein CcmE [Methylococcales bacterium]MEE2766199.1 cytochrome c maturation protein CcmE [Pseudomonadota bacterium]